MYVIFLKNMNTRYTNTIPIRLLDTLWWKDIALDLFYSRFMTKSWHFWLPHFLFDFMLFLIVKCAAVLFKFMHLFSSWNVLAIIAFKAKKKNSSWLPQNVMRCRFGTLFQVKMCKLVKTRRMKNEAVKLDGLMSHYLIHFMAIKIPYTL